jgi:membrane protein implicated in regulation of membrane protease activity
MATIFLFFAVVGGTVLVCQFVLTLMGLGSDGDIPDDLPDDVPHDLGGVGHDFAHDVHDVHAGDGHDAAHGHDGAHGHDSSWLFGIISFRTLVAAFAFFGLAGLTAQSAGSTLWVQLVIAFVSGAVAMFAVHGLMKMLGKLGEDATVRIHKALGQEGTVYVPIAAHKERAGKVQLKMQNRLMEYEAITGGEKLATGARVRVVAIRGNTLEVELAAEPVAAKTA